MLPAAATIHPFVIVAGQRGVQGMLFNAGSRKLDRLGRSQDRTGTAGYVRCNRYIDASQ